MFYCAKTVYNPRTDKIICNVGTPITKQVKNFLRYNEITELEVSTKNQAGKVDKGLTTVLHIG